MVGLVFRLTLPSKSWKTKNSLVPESNRKKSLNFPVRCLRIEPPFLFVDEDWPVGKRLPVTICPARSSLRIQSGDLQNMFQIVSLNETCASVELKKNLDADVSDLKNKRRCDLISRMFCFVTHLFTLRIKA